MEDQLQDQFQFYVPVDVTKAGKNGEMVLDGIASTEDKDRQKENMIPGGFEYEDLLNYGYINWHHQMKKDPEAVIGEPIDAQVRPEGFYIKGRLYPNSDVAKKAYKLAKTLKEDSSDRQLGWSVEGKVLERDPSDQNRVTRAKITGVALTPMPINPNTWVNVVKAMNGESKMPQPQTKNGGEQNLLDVSISEGRATLTKDGKLTVEIENALTTQSGAALIHEHVEGTPPGSKTPKQVDPTGGQDDEKNKGEVDGDDLFPVYEKIFQQYPDLEIEKARAIAQRILRNR